MKTDFSPKFFRDPGLGGALGGAASATPWGAIAQGAVGLAQTIGGWVQQHKATKKLERLKSPTYSQNQSILDYYNQALSRANVSPTDSSFYKRTTLNAERNFRTALTGAKIRHLGTQDINKLMAGVNDTSLNAEVAATNEQSSRFSQLGGATAMKAGEDAKAFQINQQDPFYREYDLLAAKASGGARIGNAGIRNLTDTADTSSQRQMIDAIYGTSRTKKGKTSPLNNLGSGSWSGWSGGGGGAGGP